MDKTVPGRLYVVATPIGNRGDLSPRARDTLKCCSLIAAEDTRHTGTLMKVLGIATPMVSLHDHNEEQRAPELVQRMRGGESIAVVSDAGTPAISDPGFALVRAAAAAAIEVVAIPGPCAAVAALSIGALPTDRFCFEGFLPARRAARRERLKALAAEVRTLVFYESPHRIAVSLADCADAFGVARPALVAREITKLHETVYRGTLAELASRAAAEADFARGEIVLVVGGALMRSADEGAAGPGAGIDGDVARDGADGHGGALDRALTVLLADLPLKQAAALAAKLVAGVRDNEAYKRALLLKRSRPS